MSQSQPELNRGYAESRVRVRYAETDQMGVVYHANYLVWFEVGRVDFIRQIGLDYRAMEQDEGALIAVVEARARYKAPARYDDELVVRTHLASVRGSVVRFTYAIVRAEDEALLCEGETVHLVVGRDMRRRPMPKRYAERFAAVLGDGSGSESASQRGSELAVEQDFADLPTRRLADLPNAENTPADWPARRLADSPSAERA